MKSLSRLRAGAVAAAGLVAWAAAGSAEPITLTLDPVYPTTADPIRVHAHFDADLCWPLSSSNDWQPPTIEGRTIHLTNGQPPDGVNLGCPNPPPADCDVTLPPLAEGSWSIDLQESGGDHAARAFDVTAPSTDLFLRDGRYLATASWRGRDGQPHSANAIALGDASGAFWFFDSSNIELTLKVLDGGALNGKLWVFLASMTDVAYTVTVVDRQLVCITTPCPNSRVYEGNAGRNANVLDVNAFPSPSSAAPRIVR